MEDFIQHKVFLEAKKLGIDINLDSLKKHHSQGYISQVFFATSNVGDIIIHLIKLNGAQEHIHVSDKIQPLLDELLQYKNIPLPKIYASFSLEPYSIFISKFLIGSQAGSRSYDGDSDFADHYTIPFEKIEDELEKIIYNIHYSFRPKKFGWILGEDIKRGGSFSSWVEFLESEISLWKDKITDGESKINFTKTNLANRLYAYFNSIKSNINYSDQPVLVHGDLTNPSNILVDKNKISGIIDWEYGLAGDPAWEFVFKSKFSLKTYFYLLKEKGISVDESWFLQRTHDYYPLMCGLWCFVHSFDPHSVLYGVCRRHLDKILKTYGF